jgi:hypothetical protein
LSRSRFATPPGTATPSAVVDGITYAGDHKFDVINMSFFVDDDEFQQSTEFKCANDRCSGPSDMPLSGPFSTLAIRVLRRSQSWET